MLEYVGCPLPKLSTIQVQKQSELKNLLIKNCPSSAKSFNIVIPDIVTRQSREIQHEGITVFKIK